MKPRSLIIGLTSDRIDVLLRHRGRIVAGRRLSVSLPSEAAAWLETVPKLSKLLRAAANELKADGAPATVLYRSPTECSELSSLKLARAADAADAAILGCADALGCPLDEAAARALLIACDKGDQPQSHVVVAADADQSVDALATMVEDAGLRFTGAAPIDALIMAGVAGEALAGSPIAGVSAIGGPSARGLSARLYIGEQRSFFVIASNGTLRFARPISAGVAALVTCLTRPLRLSPSSEPIELTREEAADIVHEFGFPQRDQVVHAERKLMGSHVSPLLQPVVQRYVVELRQSLRFALSEEERRSVKINIFGPGSAIPRFADIVLAELQLERERGEAEAAYDWRDPMSSGAEICRAAESDRLVKRLSLQPRRVARLGEARQMRRWLWTGAAATLGLIAFDALQYQGELAATRPAASALSAGDSAPGAAETNQKLLAAAGAMKKLEAEIARESGTRLYPGACLHELTRLTPESVRLTHISFEMVGGGLQGMISGYALASPDGAVADLEGFIAELARSPLFLSVSLSGVHAAEVNQRQAQRFDARFVPVTAPALAAAAAPMTAAAQEANP